MIIGMHDVQITIPTGGEAEARAFYCGMLGLVEAPKPKSLQGRGGLWLLTGNGEMRLGIEDGVDRRPRRAHVARQVLDLAAPRSRLEAAGVAIQESVPIPGMDRFEFRDPFGNRMELLQVKG